MTFYSRQNKQRGSALVIVLAITAVLATGGAIAYALISSNKDGGVVDLKSISHKTITATTSSEVKTLLTNAKAGDYDAKCTFTSESGDGTLYIKGPVGMRVDTTISDKPAHVLQHGDSVYIWADGQSEGSKFPMSDENKDSQYSPDAFANKVDEYHIKCQSVARLSDSLFTLPPSVTFVDVNSQFNTFRSSN